IDLKFGWGIVEPYMNWQLILYALGLLPETDAIRIQLHICQPRAPHIDGPWRTWVLSVKELNDLNYGAAYAATQVMSTDPQLCTGSHCRYCSALFDCPAAQKAGMGFMEVSQRAVVMGQSPVQLGYNLTVLTRAYEMIKHLKTATEQSILTTINNGGAIPGWDRTNNMGRLSWNDGVKEAVRAAADMYGKQVDKDPDLKTPTQAIVGGMPEELIKQYASRKPGKAKLVPTDLIKLQHMLKENRDDS
ncbi:unnamed protein product, partial [marine sediment metagenome]